MRILFLITTLGHGGAEKVLVNLVNNLDRSMFDVTVQTLFDVGANKNNLLSHIRYKPGYHLYFRGNTLIMKCFSPRFLFRHLIKDKYDIIVSFLEGPSARIVSGCTDNITKLISWIHIEQGNRKIASRSFRSCKEAEVCYNRFDRTVCVSESVKDDFTGIFPVSHPVGVIYNLNDIIQIKKLSQMQPTGITLYKGIRICSVGKIIEAKGFDRLVRIQKRLVSDGYLSCMYIIGCGNKINKLQRIVHKYGLDEHFIFLGYHKNPYAYVSQCDFYVCSSRREGFSTAVSEALIIGLPVISTRCSGAEELLGKHNEFGLVVANDEEALYQGIRSWLSDPTLIEKYRKKAAKRGEKFMKDVSINAVQNLFKEMSVK